MMWGKSIPCSKLDSVVRSVPVREGSVTSSLGDGQELALLVQQRL